MREKSKATVASYDIQPGNGVSLFSDTKHAHNHIHLLTYFPRTHTGTLSLEHNVQQSSWQQFPWFVRL